ncbi:MAG: SH3 domain-containing protein [Shinella sp.]|uniref:SH3 domain-containing protein n=1 Tax=Shinella sp. TaxID=1870904 RepID=UPI003C7346CA
MTFCLRMAVVLAALSGALASTPAAAADACLVDDPTGSPLNVRSAPNGTILTTLQNGARVDVVDEMKLGAKRWLFIAQQGERVGWVFGAYVVCPKGSGAREAPPSQPADRR